MGKTTIKFNDSMAMLITKVVVAIVFLVLGILAFAYATPGLIITFGIFSFLIVIIVIASFFIKRK